MAIPLLATCDIAGKDVTGDALPTQRAIAADVVKRDAHYYFTVKGLRRARELARVCTLKVTQPPAAGGDDIALPISALAAATLRPGWVSFGARKWVSFAARRGTGN